MSKSSPKQDYKLLKFNLEESAKMTFKTYLKNIGFGFLLNPKIYKSKRFKKIIVKSFLQLSFSIITISILLIGLLIIF